MRTDLRRLFRIALVPLLLAALLGWAGCILRTPHLLKAVNGKPAAPGPTPTPHPSREPAERIARIVRVHLVDSYADPQAVAIWMNGLCGRPEPVMELLDSLGASSDPRSVRRAYDKFQDEVSPALERDPAGAPHEPHSSAWGIPSPPLARASGDATSIGPLADAAHNAAAVKAELDAERFVANARPIASSLLVLQNLVGLGPFRPEDVRAGICSGAKRAAAYVQARHWKRELSRPTTALVMSGGAANGAFLAGFAWRLTEVLQHCHQTDQCAGAGLDLIVGTSSGSLVGVTADVFATAGKEQVGRDLMLHNYTCSVESDLYCVNDVWDWQLLSNTRGLVRFDGIRRKLDSMMTDDIEKNSTELVTMAVDYETGDLMAESDQDPGDGLDHQGRVNAVLASIVEPVMADPIDELGRPAGGKQLGTFIDGGVRSETPVLEAVRRGAERVIVLSSSGLQAQTEAKQKSAGAMLMRTIDLLVNQVSMTEIQQADLYAAARRLGEYNTCESRLQLAKASDPQGVEGFCSRSALSSETALKSALSVPPFTGPETFEQISRSWRAEWVARPEGRSPSASGYSFDVELMRKLFIVGVETFQARCGETLGLLGVPDSVQSTECAESEAAAAVARANAQIQTCTPSKSPIEACKSP